MITLVLVLAAMFIPPAAFAVIALAVARRIELRSRRTARTADDEAWAAYLTAVAAHDLQDIFRSMP